MKLSNILPPVLISILLIFIPFRYVNKDLKPYYNYVYEIIGECPISKREFFGLQRFYFGEVENINIEAFCQARRVGWDIVVNKDVWNIIDEDQRKSLVLHEFFHCVFDEPHSDDPKHFMYFLEMNLPLSRVEAQARSLAYKHCKMD